MDWSGCIARAAGSRRAAVPGGCEPVSPDAGGGAEQVPGARSESGEPETGAIVGGRYGGGSFDRGRSEIQFGAIREYESGDAGGGADAAGLLAGTARDGADARSTDCGFD